jgi:hypothetical protein
MIWTAILLQELLNSRVGLNLTAIICDTSHSLIGRHPKDSLTLDFKKTYGQLLT